MKTGILFKGYLLVDDMWMELSDKLNFPEETVGDNPFEYIKDLVKSANIKYYLITYDKFEIKE
jgi:hypothetical protein